MKHLFILFLLLISCHLTSIPYVAVDVMDMYDKNDPTCEVVTQAIYASPLKIIEDQGDWLFVETDDSYRGWCPQKNIFHKETPYPQGTYARVDTMWTYLYAVNDTTPHPQMSLPFNARVEVAKMIDDRWIKVRLLNGEELWAHRSDFCFDPTPLSTQAMIEKGKQFLGLPYRWGGRSSYGFDCSGFIQTLFSLRGISLPRNASQQALVVEEVTLDNLKEGDLIFFDQNRIQITHVGLYIGNGLFIHSDIARRRKPGVIRIDNLYEPMWMSTILKVGRVPNQVVYPF